MSELISALIGALVAGGITWAFNKKDHERMRKEATLEMVLYFTKAEHLRGINLDIANDIVDNISLVVYEEKKKDKEYFETFKKLEQILGTLEVFSVGIQHNVYDRSIVVETMGNMFVRNYKRYLKLIDFTKMQYISEKERGHSQTVYENFEREAKRIEKKLQENEEKQKIKKIKTRL